MYAVIKTGGKQYRVSEGDEFNIEKIEGEKGDSVTFSDVLAVGSGDSIQIGKPLVEGASVAATVVTQDRDRTVIVFKKQRRKGYQVKNGHRQYFTRVRITSISA